MVMTCCALGCTNQKIFGSSTKFYRFLSNRIVIGCSGSQRFVTGFVPDDTHRLYSEHFISGTILNVDLIFLFAT